MIIMLQRRRSTTFPSVEITVAATCSTGEELTGTVIATRHELTTAIIGMAADGSSVVAHAFFILDEVVVGIRTDDDGMLRARMVMIMVMGERWGSVLVRYEAEVHD